MALLQTQEACRRLCMQSGAPGGGMAETAAAAAEQRDTDCIIIGVPPMQSRQLARGLGAHPKPCRADSSCVCAPAAWAFLGEAWAVLGELTLPRLDYVARVTSVLLLVAILLLAFINLIDTFGVATVQAVLHKPA